MEEPEGPAPLLELPRGNELCVERRNKACSAEQMVLICTAAWPCLSLGGGGQQLRQNTQPRAHSELLGPCITVRGTKPQPRRGQPSPPGEAGLGSERIGFSDSPPSRTSLLRAASTHRWVRSGVQGGLRCGWPPGPPPAGTQAGVPPARGRHSAPLMKYSRSLGGAGGQSCLGPCALGPLSLAASRTPHLLALPHRRSPPPRPN